MPSSCSRSLRHARRSRARRSRSRGKIAQTILDLSELHARCLAALKPGEFPQARGDDFENAKTEMERKLKEFLALKCKELNDEIAAFVKATENGRKTKETRELAAEIRQRLEATPNATVPFRPPEF